jgi:glycosyltransferase involved in cell wall biosynthesis
LSTTVAAFTQGVDVPSARFRVRQLIEAMRERQVDIVEYPAIHGSYPPRALLERLVWLPRSALERARAIRSVADADVALFQREAISTLATAERLWSGRAVFDVDDAIWLHQRFRAADRLARWAGLVICGNSYLAEHFGRFARTTVIPTAVDVARFCPAATGKAKTPTIVWSGSSRGLAYVHTIEPALARVLRARGEVRLRIVCDAEPHLSNLPGDRVEFVRWNPDVEVAALQTAHLGIMPMPDDPWTRGKCSFKMLTYMACGLPVVVSPFGMNAEVLANGPIGLGAKTLDEWADALITLLDNVEQARAAGVVARDVVVREYSVEHIADRLAHALTSIT